MSNRCLAVVGVTLSLLAAPRLTAQGIEEKSAEERAAEEKAAEEQAVRARAAAELKQVEKASNTLAAPANLQLGTLPGIAKDEPKGFVGQFLVEGATDERTGTVSVGWKDGKGNFLLSAVGPLDSKSTASPISIEGLPADASIEFSFSRFEFGFSRPDEIDALHDMCTRVRLETCERTPALCPRDRAEWTQPCKEPSVPSDCANLCCEDFRDSPRERARCHPEKPAICGMKVCDYANLPAVYRPVARALLHLDDRIWFWGGSLKAGRTTFDYLDEGSLVSQSVNKTSWSASGRAGVYSSYFGFLIGSYRYQKDFTPAGDAQTVCQPLAGTNATTCADAVIGAPAEKTRSVLTFEVRRFFANGAALAPSFQRDLKNKVSAFVLPVYFIKNDKGAPIGGVRFGWRSDTDAVTVSVFIGGVLKL